MAILQPDGSWSVNLGTVPEGKHKVTAKATDWVDNDARKSVSFKT